MPTRVHFNRLATTLGMLLTPVLLTACGPSTSPLTLELRTADTHAPIANAGVEADSLALGPSLQFGDIIEDLKGKRAAFSSRSTTDQSGTAHLEYIPDRAVRITVLGPEGGVRFLLLNQSIDAVATQWLALPASPRESGAIELRAGSPNAINPR